MVCELRHQRASGVHSVPPRVPRPAPHPRRRREPGRGAPFCKRQAGVRSEGQGDRGKPARGCNFHSTNISKLILNFDKKFKFTKLKGLLNRRHVLRARSRGTVLVFKHCSTRSEFHDLKKTIVR